MQKVIINICIISFILIPIPGVSDSSTLEEYVNSIRDSSYRPVKALFSPDTFSLIAGFSRDDFTSGSMVFRIDVHTDRVESLQAEFHVVRDIAMSPDNSYLLIAGGLGRDPFFEAEIIIWPDRGEMVKIMDLENYLGETYIYSLAISEDSRYFLSGSEMPTAKLYSREGVLLRTYFPYENIQEYWQHDSPCKVDITGDRKYILTSTKQHTKLWNFRGLLVHSYDTLTDTEFPRFTPDNSAIAVIRNKNLEFLDFTGNLHQRIDVPVTGVVLAPPAFTRDGNKAAIFTEGGILLIDIRAETSREIPFKTETTYREGSISFGPGNDYLVYTHYGMTGCRILHIPSMQIITFCCFDSGDWITYDETGFNGSSGVIKLMAEGGWQASHDSTLISDFFKGGAE